VSGWYAWLARRGHIAASPAADIARPKAAPGHPPTPALTPDQALTLLRAADTAPGPQRARTAALAAVLLFTLQAKRTDRERAAFLLWGGALVGTGLTISLAQGIIHPYYTVALAPAIAALFGIGVVWAWQGRTALLPRLALALGFARVRPDEHALAARLRGRLDDELVKAAEQGRAPIEAMHAETEDGDDEDALEARRSWLSRIGV